MGDAVVRQEHGNYASCCRLCLAEPSETLKSVFEDRELPQKIASSLGVEISVDDKLSTMACLQCIEKVNNWQSFKSSCYVNQTKLEHWLTKTDFPDGNIQIKEEPIEHDSSTNEVILNGDISVKNEVVEEEFNELPPPLTPQGTDDGDVEEVIHSDEQISNHLRCSFCSKTFSSSGNRKKHEKRIHGIANLDSATESEPGSLSQDDRSQSSVDSRVQMETRTPSTNEEQKILFAAGLKLLQTNSNPPIAFENLSKIENSYTEKCKAMVEMHSTLKCACHNFNYPTLKGLLSHLRALRIWFPVFTCYHCMITFTDRSSCARHYAKCNRSNLETLVKLSNLKKRSEVKTRLYQNYKCTQCRFMYWFHEDFCTHVDEEHANITLPYRCSCGRTFDSLEDYKDHSYVSCLVEFYCDICFVTVKTLEAFQQHAVETHDASEGFILLQDDNYTQKKSNMIGRGTKREYTDQGNIVSGKRRASYKAPILEPQDDNSDDNKVANPMFGKKLPGTTCPICSREYASNNNMWRHYKAHFQNGSSKAKSSDGSLYCCPDCGGMFNTNEWEKHKEMHKKKKCNECDKIFQFQSELDQHRSVHLNLKLYRDSKTQSYKSTMVSPNTENSSVVMMCEVCDKMFTTQDQLNQHKLEHDSMPILESNESSEDKKNFTCFPCNKTYTTRSSLWDHNRKKHPDLVKPPTNFPRQCKYCDRLFYTAGSYVNHKQMHERKLKLAAEEETVDTESYHTCKRCFKVFSTRSNLKSHMKSHGSPTTKTTKKSAKKVWCDVCHCGFENTSILEQHKIDEHNESNMPILTSQEEDHIDLKTPFVFTCDVCVQTFTTKIALKKHKERHAREDRHIVKTKPILCKYCKIAFTDDFQLANHMKQEHEEEVESKPQRNRNKTVVKNFGCKLCGKNFVSTGALYAHQGWHKRQNKQNNIIEEPKTRESSNLHFQCKTCSALLATDTALQIHILERHRNVNTTILPAAASRCTMCNLEFSSAEEYDRHKRFHALAEKPKKTYDCNQCPAGFSKAEMLKAHVKQVHKFKEHRCHYCDRVFEKANSLGIHLKVHEKQKLVTGGSTNSTSSTSPKTSFSCSICNKGFTLPKDLRAHTIEAHPF